MWVIIKYKTKEFELLRNSFRGVLGKSPEFYIPKIKYEKYLNNKLKVYKKDILENYLICRHEKFSDPKIINLLKNSRGLNYFLNGFRYNQKEIYNFIDYCKSNEDQNGYLTQSFFDQFKKKKAKFISGPFTQMIFDIIEEKNSKLKILLNKVNMTISKNSNNLLFSYI